MLLVPIPDSGGNEFGSVKSDFSSNLAGEISELISVFSGSKRFIIAESSFMFCNALNRSSDLLIRRQIINTI